MAKGMYAPDPLEPYQALALVNQPSGKSFGPARDRAMFAIMWRSGLRCAECVNLDLDNIKTSTRPWHIKVLRPKGAARGAGPRTVGLDEQTFLLIEAWLRFRGLEPGPLFLTHNKTRLDLRNVRRTVTRRAAKAGLGRRVHPHALRHTYAHDLYREGVGMVHIQKALGHSSLETTARYLSKIGCDDAVEITSERSWEAS